MTHFCYYLVISFLFAIFENASGQVSPQESIYLQTDRDIYIAGENMFFKCYALNNQSKKPSGISNFAYMILRNDRNILITSICMKLENYMFSGNIYLPDTLSTGHYQLVSYTNYMRNGGEQTFFTKEVLIANRFDKDLLKIYADSLDYERSEKYLQNEKETITLSTEKNTFARREKVKIKLESTGIEETEFANLSVSVHEELPNADYIVIKKPSSVSAYENNSQPCKYFPEINGVVLQGKVYNSENQTGIPKALVFLSTPDSVSNLQFTNTDHSGNFKFQLNDYYFDKNLVINLPSISKSTIELDNKFDLKMPFKPIRYFSGSFIRDFISKSQNIVQVKKTYKKDSYTEISDKPKLNVHLPLAYPPVSDAIYPADFVSLPDFVEISREILPLLKTRKHKGIYEARMINLNSSQFFDSDPLVFLDGVPIDNINSIINLGTDKIRKIETIGTERYLGGLYFPGILSVFTRTMEINSFIWKSPVLYTKYVISFSSTMGMNSSLPKNQRDPDFRQLLYWEPYLIMKGKESKFIEFPASDNKGNYIITVEGFTSNGNFIHTSSVFNVTNRSK